MNRIFLTNENLLDREFIEEDLVTEDELLNLYPNNPLSVTRLYDSLEDRINDQEFEEDDFTEFSDIKGLFDNPEKIIRKEN